MTEVADEIPENLQGVSNNFSLGEKFISLIPAIINTINIPILIMDGSLQVKFATTAFYQEFDFTPGQLLGSHFYKLVNCPGNNASLIQRLFNLECGGISIEESELACTFSGRERFYKMNAAAATGEDGEKVIILSIHDITDWCTEKQKLETITQKLEEKLVLTTESAQLGTWQMESQTGITSWDTRCSNFFGTSVKTLPYSEFLQKLHPDDREATDAEITKATSGTNDGLYNIEFRTIFNNSDTRFWLRASGKVYFDENGNAVHLAGTVTDITLQKLNEQLLKESEERFRVAADAAAVLIWLSTPYRSRNYFNKSWLAYVGQNYDHQMGFRWKETIHNSDQVAYNDIYETSFEKRKKYTVEYKLRRHDGEYRWVSEVGAPRFSPAGIFEGYIGTCIDIHDQKRTTEELEQQVEERTQLLSKAVANLEASNQNLEEFAYVASHDLQEPLRKIQSFETRLQDKTQPDLSDRTRLYLSKITGASNRMSQLIGDLLKYSKLKNTSELLEITDLDKVVENVLSDFDLVIQHKQAKIIRQKLPVIKAMPTRVAQLFHNLISNALKFTRAGVTPVIHIHTSRLPEEKKSRYPSLDQSRDYEMITFEDNGIGFDQEYSEKVFNIFQRLNGMSDYEGTGIGLAICRKIVINHHGLIFAESQENEGTKFHIILPAFAGPGTRKV
jgi:PAS domain S-box-containing protein